MLMCWLTWLLATCSFPRLGTALMRSAVIISLHANKHTYNGGHDCVAESSRMHLVRPMMHACDTTLQASCVYMQLAAEVLHCHLHCKMHYQHKST